jgi:hypothetical protein
MFAVRTAEGGGLRWLSRHSDSNGLDGVRSLVRGKVFTVRQNLFRPALGPSSPCVVGSGANSAQSKGQNNGYFK